jgi:very-short-patch-repair endonuclease
MLNISRKVLELEDASKQQFADYLKSHLTTAEKTFWKRVKDGQIPSLNFEPQKIINGWIVDFYSPSINLIIEIDGSSHDRKETKKIDAVKDEKRKNSGYLVLRFSNLEIKLFLEHCVARVCQVALIYLTGKRKTALRDYMKFNGFSESEDVLFYLRNLINGNGQRKISSVKVSERRALKNLARQRLKPLLK